MQRVVISVVGALVVVIGAVFTLQGLNVLGGSAMSGKSMWAVVGPIIVIAGLVVIGYAWRRSRVGGPPAGH